jgi:hypothetical protein
MVFIENKKNQSFLTDFIVYFNVLIRVVNSLIFAEIAALEFAIIIELIAPKFFHF